MEYFVTGATGLIGRSVVEHLVADGHAVSALVSSRAEAAPLPGEVTAVEGGLSDTHRLREGMAGADRVFHMGATFFVGPGPVDREETHANNVSGTRAILELVDDLDVSRVVYTSTIGVAAGTDGLLDDESRASPGFEEETFLQTQHEAYSEVVAPMVADGLPVVTVRLGGVFGPDDGPVETVETAFEDWQRGKLRTLPRKFALTPSAFVEDVARLHLLAMEVGEVGESYLIASELPTATG